MKNDHSCPNYGRRFAPEAGVPLPLGEGGAKRRVRAGNAPSSGPSGHLLPEGEGHEPPFRLIWTPLKNDLYPQVLDTGRVGRMSNKNVYPSLQRRGIRSTSRRVQHELVFRLVDPYMDNNVVQIWNKDQNRLFATLITLPEYRNEPSAKTEFQLEERGQGSPVAIKSWFNEGDSTGHEFMYPQRSSATE